MSNGSETNRSDELIKFGILIIVLIGVVLIVAVARPLIFEHIVPIVLGDGIETAPPRAELAPINPDPDVPEEPAAEEVEEVEEAQEAEEAEEAVTTDAYPAAVEEEAVDLPVEAYPAPADEALVIAPVEANALLETAEETVETVIEPPTPQSVSHIITTGETLTSIAEKYGTTVNDILAVNSLVSPNRINSGDTVIVPLP